MRAMRVEVIGRKNAYGPTENAYSPNKNEYGPIACVASVPVRNEGNWFLHSGRAKNGARAKRWKEGDGGGERRERLPANPSIL